MAGLLHVGLVFFPVCVFGVLVSQDFHLPPDAPTGACVNTTDTEKRRQP